MNKNIKQKKIMFVEFNKNFLFNEFTIIENKTISSRELHVCYYNRCLICTNFFFCSVARLPTIWGADTTCYFKIYNKTASVVFISINFLDHHYLFALVSFFFTLLFLASFFVDYFGIQFIFYIWRNIYVVVNLVVPR